MECNDANGVLKGQLSLLKNTSLTKDTSTMDGSSCSSAGGGGEVRGTELDYIGAEKDVSEPPVQLPYCNGSAGK